MDENSFAATPQLCLDEIPDAPVIMRSSAENFIVAYDRIMSKLKEFEGVHILSLVIKLHWGDKPSGKIRIQHIIPRSGGKKIIIQKARLIVSQRL